MKEKNSMIDMTRANRLGLRLELIIIVILTICYVIQGGKNSITVPSLIVLLLTLWVPVILARLVFKKEQDSELIKHIIGIGYGIFYIAVCVLSDQQLVFTYAFPMLIVVTIYCDMKFSITVGSAVCVISLLHGIVCTMRAGFSDVAIAALEIQIAATVLIAVYSVLGNQFIIQITKEHLDKINDAAKKTEVMMDSIMDVSNALADEVDNVSDKMHMLETSSQEINTAMQEVSSGSNETAESVQNQLVKTEEIQTQINRVTEVAESIGSDVANTVEACNEGRGNINELLDKSKISEKAGVTVASEVEALKDATEKMESIVSLIKSVASQTSLLALNASIEAARAGEAGKGFAVVASEISSLADQTQTATGNISELITSISTVVTEVVDSINSLVENNRSQNESANITNGSFEKIIENIQSIRVNSDELTGVVSKLAGANQEIVESIQTISAITEQVSAHSSNTCETAENNEAVVEEIIAIVQKMNENAEQLAKLSV